MARKTRIELIDDIDGTPADESVQFTVRGVTYNIDLTTENAEKFDAALAPYTDVAERVGGRRRGTSKANTTGDDVKAVRAWAQENGFEIGDRGRIPNNVYEAYAAAHKS